MKLFYESARMTIYEIEAQDIITMSEGDSEKDEGSSTLEDLNWT